MCVYVYIYIYIYIIYTHTNICMYLLRECRDSATISATIFFLMGVSKIYFDLKNLLKRSLFIKQKRISFNSLTLMKIYFPNILIVQNIYLRISCHSLKTQFKILFSFPLFTLLDKVRGTHYIILGGKYYYTNIYNFLLNVPLLFIHYS